MTGLVWDVGKLRNATEAAGIALWSWNVDTNRLEMDERGHILWGVPNTGAITFETLSARIHPEDLDRVGPLSQLPATYWAVTKPTFAFCTMTKSVGYPHAVAATIRASLVGSCTACSLT